MLLATRIHALRRAAVRAGFVDRGGRGLLTGALVLGSAALVARAALGLGAADAAWFLAPLALVPFWAWWRARASAPGVRAAAAWLDARAGGDGALVTAEEVADPRWEAQGARALARAPRPAGPALRPAALRILGGAAFVCAALLVPITRLAPRAGPPPGMFEAATERLREKLAALEEQVTLDEEEARELEEALARLEEEVASASDPEATFEALDRLEARVEEAAEEALDAALQAEQSLADAASRAAAGLSADEELRAGLDALDAAGIDIGELPAGLELGDLDFGPDGLELPEGITLDPELAAALSKELREALRKKLEALAAAGLLGAGRLGELGELRPVDAELLAALAAADLKALEPCPLCKDLPPGEP